MEQIKLLILQEKLDRANNMLKEHGIECFTYSSDIRDYEKIKEIVQNMMKDHEISGLINNAAGNFISRTEDLSMNPFNLSRQESHSPQASAFPR